MFTLSERARTLDVNGLSQIGVMYSKKEIPDISKETFFKYDWLIFSISLEMCCIWAVKILEVYLHELT